MALWEVTDLSSRRLRFSPLAVTLVVTANNVVEIHFFSQSVLAFHCQLSFRQYVMPIHPLCASGTAKRAAGEVPMDCLTTLKINTKSKAA
jgi:hypothetical protein